MNHESQPVPVLEDRYDVVIIGGGLAGLTLARHLLLETTKRVLMIEQRPHLPTTRQKVGESTVQLAGHYLGKVLDLEEHLFLEHFMKYNLRFLWRAEGREGAGYEDYGQSYIRPFSNIPSYQVDRNVIEAELLQRNLADARFTLVLGARRLDVALASGAGDHHLSFEQPGAADEKRRVEVDARWVVDASGRNRVLAKRSGLKQPSTIRHGASFLWVEGQIDLEKLTSRSRRDIRLDPARRHIGHLPVWLATNHFCGEGFWLWVIPLRGKTSIGLVYEHDVLHPSTVANAEKLIAWIVETFPLFGPVFAERKVLDWWGYRSFAHDCARTLHPQRWAITGEAGRFTDPLYSPGSDLIAVYNTLIVDAIETEEASALEAKASQAEALMRAVYEAYVPGYTLTYETLGDQECFSLKYVWELTIYFGFYVFPFVNELLTERRFLVTYLNTFARLGPLNQRVQKLIKAYYQFKKERGRIGTDEPCHFDFTSIGTLAKSAEIFYEVGVPVDRAKSLVRSALVDLEELARFMAVYIAARSIDAPELVARAAFVEGVLAGPADGTPKAHADANAMRFDLARWRDVQAAAADDDRAYAWSFCPRIDKTLAPEAPGAGQSGEMAEASVGEARAPKAEAVA